MEPFETGILGRIATSAGNVHGEDDPAAERSEQVGLMVDPGDLEVEEGGHGGALQRNA
jgi:hypothetical protein